MALAAVLGCLGRQLEAVVHTLARAAPGSAVARRPAMRMGLGCPPLGPLVHHLAALVGRLRCGTGVATWVQVGSGRVGEREPTSHMAASLPVPVLLLLL